MARGYKMLVAAGAILLFLSPVVSHAQEQMDDSAQALFRLANQERKSRGIRPLKWDNSLADSARLHALKMAEQRTLSHQLKGEPDLPTRERDAGAKISAAAENIASGSNVSDIHLGWMDSPGHRRNLLNPQYDSVGIAVVQMGPIYYAVEDFSRALANLSLAEQEKMVEKAARAAGLTIRLDNSDARRVCEGRQPSNSQPRFIAKFTSTDLRVLPEALERTLRSDGYIEAEIGACAEPATDGMSEYHIAVLLY